ncbi:hypothetical protein LWI29_010092 [Acer saccharum]|uniref:Uncharacterized protein n=1 Tax=Acer saccharum TaxID=4024 RepID=A0AA39T5U4_ACESA|nr:hypothetical protein LWI29_010092 [Acer saccharum]
MIDEMQENSVQGNANDEGVLQPPHSSTPSSPRDSTGFSSSSPSSTPQKMKNLAEIYGCNFSVRDNTSLASSAHSNSKEEACSKEDAMRPDQLNDSPCHYTGFASCETTDKRADQAHSFCMMLPFQIYVKYADEVFDLRLYEPEDCSFISIVNDVKKEITGHHVEIGETWELSVTFPWNNNTHVISSDEELMIVFEEFDRRPKPIIEFDLNLFPLAAEIHKDAV